MECVSSEKEIVLGVEGGATKTEWVQLIWNSSEGVWDKLSEGRESKANFKLMSSTELEEILKKLPQNATKVGVFLAGVVSEEDKQQLEKVVKSIWPFAKSIAIGSDRDSGFAASFDSLDDSGIVVIAGTGSSITGKSLDGQVAIAGGKGHILGDGGSAYHIAVQALRLIMNRFDKQNQVCELTKAILSHLLLNRVEQLIDWTQKANKSSIAQLSTVVFNVYQSTNDLDLLEIFKNGNLSLAKSVQIVSQRLSMHNPTIVLRGSMFTKQSDYVKIFEKTISSFLPTREVKVSDVSGAIGAARLASKGKISSNKAQADKTPRNDEELQELIDAVTEQRNIRSFNLDQLSNLELVHLFIEEENYVYRAVKGCADQLDEAIGLVSRALASDGHLFYVGAGTSGRLGVLDASEIPPTFGEPSSTVQGIIAGGVEALHRSVEGAEDKPSMGAMAIQNRGVTHKDVVCGISASGRTPFVIGALERAKSLGAKTVFISCNPNRVRKVDVDVEIILETGPELVTGSTRLKAGTATKVVLNIISTCSMVRLGKVKSNLMVSLKASNFKLKDRAIRLVQLVNQCTYEQALNVLILNQWDVTSIIK